MKASVTSVDGFQELRSSLTLKFSNFRERYPVKAKIQVLGLALYILQARMQHHVSIFNKIDHFLLQMCSSSLCITEF